MKDILIGLQIFNKYDTDADFCAEHDQVWVRLNKSTPTREDFQTLNDNGWFCEDNLNKLWSHFC